MRKIITAVLWGAITLCSSIEASAYNGIWQSVDATIVPTKGTQIMHPLKYAVFSMNTNYVKGFLSALPADYNRGQILELPLPDGTYRDFKVWETPMMQEKLAAEYPQIKTFTAEAVDDPRVTAKIDYTTKGFHAMIFDGANTAFIDPYGNVNDGYYMCHYMRDETRLAKDRMTCLTDGSKNTPTDNAAIEDLAGPKLPAARTVSGYELRTYRLALACDHEYAQAVDGPNPTYAGVLSAMTTTMNRVNGVYEREFSLTMTMVNNEDTLIWLTATGDPYTNSDGGVMLGQNQTVCDDRIGTANYDIGHVFSTGGGGIAWLGCVCNSGDKAGGVTGSSNPIGDGFDIDYVAHEMGHQYGSDHSFNNNSDGSCGGNAAQMEAYEPGSGSTIMAYAGICSQDDIQPHSDAYFAAISLTKISDYITTGHGNTCPVKTPTSNKPVGLPSFTASYKIPFLTPFILTAPTAIDSVADTLDTYCWEQWNLGDFGKRLENTHKAGPIFRSFSPDTSKTRIFPKLDSILNGTYSYVGSTYEDREGEKVPDTARYLTFKLTVRNIAQGLGAFLFPDDTVHIDVIKTSGAFSVTSQNTTGINWNGLSHQTVTWDVVGTNTAPINSDSVTIYLSPDGGHTWSISMGNFPNTGSALITVPNIATNNTVRVIVKSYNNIFFNVNSKNFTITHTDAVPEIALSDNISIYPVPATDVLHIAIGGNNSLAVKALNEVGQTIWSGKASGQSNISVSNWAKGVYYFEFIDKQTGERAVKSVVIN